jgi:hypothetical protein
VECIKRSEGIGLTLPNISVTSSWKQTRRDRPAPVNKIPPMPLIIKLFGVCYKLTEKEKCSIIYIGMIHMTKIYIDLQNACWLCELSPFYSGSRKLGTQIRI